MINYNLTIIIITFNSSKIIKQSLENIDRNKYPVIIVDNASSDNTVLIIESNFPSLKIIKNNKNIGYGRANNIALRQVETEFALLLNVDATIDVENIDKIIGLMKENQDIAISDPLLFAKKYLDKNNFKEILVTKINKKVRKYHENDNFYFNQFITGASMFLNMNAMKNIGFFDEGFFLYCEDNEICKRAIKHNYKTAIVKNTKFYHVSGGSCEISEKERRVVYWHRFGWSQLYYTEKVWGLFVAKLKAIRMISKFSFLCLKYLFKIYKIPDSEYCGLKGSIGYLIGLKAFDENGNPRG
ncbi:MAG: glycosyltransferase family 2 protein [Rickettsiales bacterium]|nr:glycosyltransferase family 2 protein [Rickettsiales bacterium]